MQYDSSIIHTSPELCALQCAACIAVCNVYCIISMCKREAPLERCAASTQMSCHKNLPVLWDDTTRRNASMGPHPNSVKGAKEKKRKAEARCIEKHVFFFSKSYRYRPVYNCKCLCIDEKINIICYMLRIVFERFSIVFGWFGCKQWRQRQNIEERLLQECKSLIL